MKLYYGIALILMIFVSACAQQVTPEAPPAAEAAPAAPAPAPEPAPVVPEPEVEAPVAAPSGSEVRMLGVGQYDPEEVTISAGGTITFFNQGDILTVVTVKGPSGTTSTPVIKSGDKYEVVFEEAGEYDAWALSYGPGVKVTVK